jgi:parallel beta-helix repeat protein
MDARLVSRWLGALMGGAIIALGAPTSPAAAETSGTLVVTSDATLTEDHQGNIVVAADGVTLDCDGHAVTGPGQYQGILVSGFNDVTIRNCRVSGFGNGIAVIIGSNRARIEGNETWGNSNAGVAAGDAFFDPGSGLVITGNTSWGNGGNGIQVVHASGASILGNTAYDNHGSGGIGVGDFHDGLIAENTLIDNNDHNSGLWMARSTGNVFRDNVVRGNTYSVWLNGSDHNTIEGNLVTDGHAGVFLTGSSWNTVRENRAMRNTAMGFGAVEGSIWDPSQGADHNVFTDNVSIANHSGVTIFGSRGNVVSSNRLDRNLENGISVQEARRTTLTANLVLRSGTEGVLLREADGGAIVRNSVVRSDGLGLRIESSMGNVFRRNVVCANLGGNISDDDPAANLWEGTVVCGV